MPMVLCPNSLFASEVRIHYLHLDVRIRYMVLVFYLEVRIRYMLLSTERRLEGRGM